MKSSLYRVGSGRNPGLLLALSVLMLCLFASLSTVAYGAGEETPVPDAVQQLARKSVDAANTHRSEALSSFTPLNALRAFGWAQETTTKHWEGGILQVPHGTQKDYLMIFHAWHTCESDGDHIHKIARSGQNWMLGEEIPETDPGAFRVRDHDLNLHFDVPNKSVRITDTVKMAHVEGASAGFCVLRLSEDFRVRTLRQDSATGAEIPYQQVGGILGFMAPAGSAFTIYLEYAGKVDHRGSDYILDNEATLDSYWYPHIARLPATATITVTAPPGWTPIAQGELTRSTTAEDGAVTVTYRNDVPVCFFTVDIGMYQITTRQSGNHTLAAYLLHSDAGLARECLDTLEKALNFYDKTFAPFPYTHYAMVQTNGSFEGALEAYSFATFGHGALPSAVAHELAHTWWGGLVPCTYTRSMWDESFADYTDGLFQRLVEKHAAAIDAGGSAGLLRKGAVGRLPFSVFTLLTAHDTSDDRQSAVGYIKGGLVLRVLEDQIGLDAMLKSMATFATTHRRGADAEWSDFEKCVHTVTGNNYDWFFREWLDRTGLPSLQWANVKTGKMDAETLVEGDIVQSGVPYRLRVHVEASTATEHVDRVIEVEGAHTHVALRLHGAPTRLALDPEGILPIAPASPAPGSSDPTVYTFPTNSNKAPKP